MKNQLKIVIKLLILFNSILFSSELEIDFSFKEDYSSNYRNYSFTHIVGIMVEFQQESIQDDPTTSGDGTFLDSLDIAFIEYDNISRCSKAILDTPPHNRTYFNHQIEAVSNYYKNISNNDIDLNYFVVDSVYTLSNFMRDYSYSENHLTSLYLESLELASNDIDIYLLENNLNIDDVMFVVFHSGLGQDIKAGIFDPTIYDIHSAYIDDVMFDNLNESNLDNVCINNDCWASFNNIKNGILLPETLNMIFYDVVEDVLPITFVDVNQLEDIYCNTQYGITGLFSYLLGYALGFPPMHDTESGFTRIGKFGLMDQGSFNGRGLIPAIPDPWTRINFLSYPFNDITDSLFYSGEVDISLPKRSLNDTIYKVSISENEYFLIEHSYNRLEYNNELLELDAIPLYLEENYNDEYYWMDVINLLQEDFTINNGVVTDIFDYDYGMPGSGILIWHIVEPLENDYYSGINNDNGAKAVHLEEGDGIINLGLLNPYPGLLSDELISGYDDDYWYKNNQTYLDVNGLVQNSVIKFFNNSIPNSRTTSNIDSYVTMKINSEINDVMNITISLNPVFEIELLAHDFKTYLGNNGKDCIYYLNDENHIYSKCENTFTQLFESDFLNQADLSLVNENFIILCDLNENLYLLGSNNYYIDIFDNSSIKDEIINPMAYYYNLDDDIMDEIDMPSDGFALGDIDADGLDELVVISNESLMINNSNDMAVNGFPVIDQFHGTPLIVDVIYDNYNTPEIICKNGDKISIISTIDGSILYNFPLYDYNASLSFMNDIDNNESILINGDKLIKFEAVNESGIYWANEKSTTYNYPIVSGQEYLERLNLANIINDIFNIGIDVSKAYNYPNPCFNQTSFRFFVGNSNSVSIRIYDVSGKLIDEVFSDNLIQNEYNEISWNTNNLMSGLYLAEIKSDMNESKLIKIIIN